MTQQARQLTWALREHEADQLPLRFLIHDRDSKFSQTFDTVFEAEGFEIIRTPYRAPQANAYAERWIRSLRNECLDHILILGAGHLQRVVQAYVQFYNTARPHQGIGQQAPLVPQWAPGAGEMQARPVLGGIINDYYRRAA